MQEKGKELQTHRDIRIRDGGQHLRDISLGLGELSSGGDIFSKIAETFCSSTPIV